MSNLIIAELKRKSFHLLILLFPAIYLLLGAFYAMVIFYFLAFFILLLEFFRCRDVNHNMIVNCGQDKVINNLIVKFVQKILNIFVNIMRPEEAEGKKLLGITWLILAVIFCFSFFETNIVIIAFVILAIADTNAAIVGKAFYSDKFFTKSSFGSLAFYISSLVISMTGALILDAKLATVLVMIFSSTFITILESCKMPFDIDDNLTVPLGFCFCFTVLNYCFNIIFQTS